ncbi:MAG: helix-turn-helix transcriptional regulator [Halanaerobiales bacterium]|nr:helix-turn-helix transcriptional regulator [Halanaerobiales bacterium]
MKNIGVILKKERKRSGMTQQQLANLIPGLTRSSISKYESGSNIPQYNLDKIIEVLKSPRLKLAVSGTVINSPLLDNVDLSPLATQQKMLEELKETLDSLKSLNLINKLDTRDLNEKEKEVLFQDVLIQVCDLDTCSSLFMASMAENFNIDIQKLEKSEINKMKNKGYISRGLY